MEKSAVEIFINQLKELTRREKQARTKQTPEIARGFFLGRRARSRVIRLSPQSRRQQGNVCARARAPRRTNCDIFASSAWILFSGHGGRPC